MASPKATKGPEFKPKQVEEHLLTQESKKPTPGMRGGGSNRGNLRKERGGQTGVVAGGGEPLPITN